MKGKFVCDCCGKIINCPEEGYLEWIHNPKTGTYSGFHIVHHRSYSPKGSCYYDDNNVALSEGESVSDMDLERCMGPDGLVHLLALLEDNPSCLNEITEIIRRIQIPGYEEARRYFRTAADDGYFEGADMTVVPYLQISLNEITERYGEK